MKAIKFRAWDIKYSEMIATGFTVIGEVTMFGIIDQYVCENPIDGRCSIERYNDIILMQFTGLKDINEKDIYEGDILKWTSWKKDIAPYNNIVEFYAGNQSCGYRIRNKSFFKALTGNGIFNAKAEVIGNIYQNPKILTP